MKDEAFPYVDVISVNQYTGWYEGELNEWADFVSGMKTRLKEIGMDSKPVLFSEFGVGAMFGCKTFDGLRWTENYQQEYYDHTINLFLSDEDLSGVYLWQFSDIRSNAKWSMVRVRSFNNKGIVMSAHKEWSHYLIVFSFLKGITASVTILATAASSVYLRLLLPSTSLYPGNFTPAR